VKCEPINPAPPTIKNRPSVMFRSLPASLVWNLVALPFFRAVPTN
jgi:hypothetical protein